MARPVLLQDDFSGGMKPDLPIAQMPRNAVRNVTNLLPGISEAPLSARNGWARMGASFSTTYAAAIAFAPFTAGAQYVGIADTGAVFQVPPSGSNTTRGTAQVPIQPPVFYRNVLYIPSNDGSTSVKSYGGSSNAAAASGSPPAGMLCTTYKDHLVLARNAATPRRVWFSSGGDATSWDTASDGQWLDATHPVTGLATVRNMILVFAEEGVERLRGDIIPGVAGSDMVREPLPIPGCADPASIVVADDVCYYANATGIYMTDGIGSVDLTQQGGIKNWWNTKLTGYDNGWIIAGGMVQGKYIVAVHDGSSLETCLVLDVTKRAFFELDNIPAIMFASVPSGYANSSAGGLFFAERDAPYLVDATRIFERRSQADDGASGDSEDDNGVTMSVRLRTGFFKGVEGRKRFKKVYVTLATDAAQSVTVKAWRNEILKTGQEITVGTVAGNTTLGRLATARRKLPLSRATDGLVLDITADLDESFSFLELFRLEAEILPSSERSR